MKCIVSERALSLNWNKFMHILIANYTHNKVRCLCHIGRFTTSNVCEKLWIFLQYFASNSTKKINCCSLRQVDCETWSWLCLMATHLLCHLFMQSHKHTHGKETISKTVRDVSYINLRLDWIAFIVRFCVSPCFKM